MLRSSLIAVSVGVLLILCSYAIADTEPAALDLKSALNMALSTNPRIGSAQSSVDISEYALRKAGSARYPKLGVESSYSYLTKETIFGSTPVWEKNTVINRLVLRQMIYSGGQVEADIDKARQGYIASSFGAAAAQADVLTNVANTYFRARQAWEAVRVAESSVKSLEKSYYDAQKLHEAGVVTNTDVLRAQVALISARENVITYGNNYNIALAALKSAIGLPSDIDIGVCLDAVDTIPEVALQSAPAERPEISAGKAYVQAAESGVRAARAGRLPTVALAADYFNEPVGAQFPRLTNTVLAGVVVNFNVFDGGLTRAGISEADAASRKARQNLEAEARRVELEQTAAKMDLESAEARLETTATRIQSAEESLRALQAGYAEGITPLTDVLSAETALTSARVSRLAALYDLKIAQVNLLRAYGQTDGLIR